MRKALFDELPYWLQGNFTVTGREPEDENKDDNSDDVDDEDEDDDSDDDEEGGGSGDDSKKKDDSKEDTSQLKKALRKERQDRKNAQRELRKIQREGKNKENSDELAEARESLATATERIGKLGPKYRDLEVNSKIRELAREMDFIDITDVLDGIKREDIEVDQDEDDPSEVEVDEDSVKDALEALAKRKPHWLKSSATDDEEDGEDDAEGGKPKVKSGSKMRGRKKTNGTKKDEASLRATYPSL